MANAAPIPRGDQAESCWVLTVTLYGVKGNQGGRNSVRLLARTKQILPNTTKAT